MPPLPSMITSMLLIAFRLPFDEKAFCRGELFDSRPFFDVSMKKEVNRKHFKYIILNIVT